MIIFFASKKAKIIHHIMQCLTERRGLKYSLNLQVNCYKEKDGEKMYASPHFWSNSTTLLNNEHVEIDCPKGTKKYSSLLTHIFGRVVGGCLMKLSRSLLDWQITCHYRAIVSYLLSKFKIETLSCECPKR